MCVEGADKVKSGDVTLRSSSFKWW